MSRIGKLPISIPENIKVSLINNEVILESGKVKKNYKVSSGIIIDFKPGLLLNTYSPMVFNEFDNITVDKDKIILLNAL